MTNLLRRLQHIRHEYQQGELDRMSAIEALMNEVKMSPRDAEALVESWDDFIGGASDD